MKINIYPIVSSLHEAGLINSETNKLINEIKELLNASVNICDIDNFYDADMSLVLVQSGGSEGAFLREFAKLKEPYYLLTYGSNNSLAASLEILSYLKDRNLKAEVLHGSANYIASRISKLTHKVNLPYKRLGVLGKPSDWLISSDVNYSNVKDKLNVELINISMEEVINDYNNYNELIENNYDYDQKEINSALRLYKVLSNIKDKYNLDGLTIRCFDLLSTIKTTACLSLALFNDKNIIGTCEGDIPAMLSMHIANILTNSPGFQANPSEIDVENSVITFAHCTLPFNMTTSYKLDTHFESGIGVAIRGKLREEEVTIFKLSHDLKDYYVTTGKIISNLDRDDLCRTQIKIKVDNNIEYFLNRPFGNHHIIIYGNHVDKIKELLG